MLHKIFCFTALLMLTAGCSDSKAPDPPTARAELTARLFDELKARRLDSATAIIDKLLALDPDDADLMEMRDRLTANKATLATQNYVNRGELENALAYIQKQRKQYPVMPKLRILEEEVRGLITLRDAAQRLADAQTIPELSTALENIAPLAAKYPTAKKLHIDIKLRRRDLDKMRADAANAVVETAEKTDKSDKQ